jgi:hypothetical protein
MKRVGQRVVDDVNLGVGDQVGIGIHHPLHPVSAGEGFRSAAVTGRHRHDPVTPAAGEITASSAMREAPSTPIRSPLTV